MLEEPILLKQAYIECEKHVAVISYNMEDFQNWRRDKHFKETKSWVNAFTVGNIHYRQISIIDQLRGAQYDEVIKTPKAWYNKDYYLIMSEIQECINPNSAFGYKLKRYMFYNH